jgi:hypothetical protein
MKSLHASACVMPKRESVELRIQRISQKTESEGKFFQKKVVCLSRLARDTELPAAVKYPACAD